MNRIIVGFLVAICVPVAAHAQTGKHVAVGGSVVADHFSDARFKQVGDFSFLYRLSKTGHARDGWSLVPSGSVDYALSDFRPDVGGPEFRLGRLRSVPTLLGLGPQYRHGRTEVGFSAQAGASFNRFTMDQAGRITYGDRLSTDLEDVDTRTSFAAQLGTGVWYDVNSRLGLHAGVSYLYNRPDARITTDGVTTVEHWNADYVGFSLGAAIGLF